MFSTDGVGADEEGAESSDSFAWEISGIGEELPSHVDEKDTV